MNNLKPFHSTANERNSLLYNRRHSLSLTVQNSLNFTQHIAIAILSLLPLPVVTMLVAAASSSSESDEVSTGNHPCHRYKQCPQSTRNKAETK